MRAIQVLFAILIALGPLATIAELLPPSEMRPIQPAEEQANFGIHRMPNEYDIGLKPAYSIKDHFKTIGKDLEHLVNRRWDDPELNADYASFIFLLEDPSLLDLVRRDPDVTFVGEAASYSPTNVWTDDHEVKAKLLPPSEMKPITPAEEQANFDIHRFPDEYEIHLEPGYTIDAHFKTIGKDLSHFIKRRWDYGYLDAEYALFAIHLECVEDVNLVRRDPGVTFIGESAGYSQQNIWTYDHLLPFSEMIPIEPADRD